MESFFVDHRIDPHTRRISHFYFWLAMSLILIGCTNIYISTPLPKATQKAIVPTVLSTSTSNILSWCNDLKQLVNLPLSNQIRKSHIIYINKLNSPTIKSQLWVISMEDGTERMLFDNVPTDIVSFQPDGYHFLIFDVLNGLFQSDLSGKPFQPIEDKAKAADFYEKVYSHDSINTYSPDKKYSAIWDWKPVVDVNQAIPLIIHNNDSGQSIKVFQSGPGEMLLGNWSPDGKRYIFTWYKNIPEYYSVIYAVNADGTGLAPLTEHLNSVTLDRPYWSPDGTKIAVGNANGGNDMWILDLPSKKLSHFEISSVIDTNSQVVGGTLAWSPDGKWIAYISIMPLKGIILLNTESGESYCGNNDMQRTIEMMDWK